MGKTATAIGCRKASIWARTEGETVTYGTVIDMSEKIISVTYSPRVVTANLDAGDKVVDTYSAKTGAEGEVIVTDLTSADRIAIYGETADGDTNVEKTTDFTPYAVLAWATSRSDGKLNLYKVMKAQFTPGEEKGETITKDSVNYQTTNLKYQADADGDVIRYTYFGADPTTDADFIEDWFETANFYKETTSA